MIKGIYTTAAGLHPLVLAEDITSNNLANLNTTGFKKEALHFNQILDSQFALANQIDNESDIANVEDVMINYSQGELRATNNPLDVAIDGKGFFAIQTPDGERYTRNGNFKILENGQLVTAEGNPVLGMSKTIELLPGEVKINEKGEILQNGVLVDQLKIVNFEEPYPLQKQGEGLFNLTKNAVETNNENNVTIHQGYLEESNVNPIAEMVKLITISKIFQAGQRSIQNQDRTLEKLVNSVGKY